MCVRLGRWVFAMTDRVNHSASMWACMVCAVAVEVTGSDEELEECRKEPWWLTAGDCARAAARNFHEALEATDAD